MGFYIISDTFKNQTDELQAHIKVSTHIISDTILQIN